MDRNLRRNCILIFFLALALRIFVAWHAGYFRTRGDSEMARIADSILRFHVYGNPYKIPTGPTAHDMPLFPLFLAGVHAIFGTGRLAEAVNVILSCSLSALRCALLLPFCVSLGLSSRTGIVAGSLGSVYISAIETEVRGCWDGPWQALLLLALTWITVRIWKDESWLNRIPWLWILLWATAILLAPALAPVLAALLLAGFFYLPSHADQARYLRLACMVGLATAIFLLPWAVRNKLQLGKFIWTRSNLGLELWVANGPNRAYDITNNTGYRVSIPSSDIKEAQLVKQMGEVAYNKVKLGQAREWIRQHPADFAVLTARRFLAFWFPLGITPIHTIVRVGFSVLALAGLVLLFRIQRLLAFVFLLTWISFSSLYYIIQWSTRYRYPIEWELVICAAVALTRSIAWFPQQRFRASSGQGTPECDRPGIVPITISTRKR